jgi:uncharacterized protein YjbI with pentapeptide repeats
MIRADFSEAKIESSNLQGIVMRDVNLDDAEIFDSRLNGMRIHHGGMANLSLRHLDLDGLSIGFSQMNGAIIHDLGGTRTSKDPTMNFNSKGTRIHGSIYR